MDFMRAFFSCDGVNRLKQKSSHFRVLEIEAGRATSYDAVACPRFDQLQQ